MKKVSAVDWIEEQYHLKMKSDGQIHIDELNDIFNEARQMEINIAQNYAEFCVLCHINNLPFLDFKSYIEKVEA